MSFVDRFSLVFQMILFAFAIFITIRAFGKPRKLTLNQHLDRNHLTCHGSDDPAFMVASMKPMSYAGFRALCDRFPAAFSQKESPKERWQS